MEITKNGKFITDFYGSQPAVGATEILRLWLEKRVDKSLLSFAEQIKKKEQTAHQAIEEILSVFNRGPEMYPIIGNWMLHKCLVNTGLTIFNAKNDNTHPKQDAIRMGITLVSPPNIYLFDQEGKIEQPNGIKTCTVSIVKPKRSFFKAYEVINAGAMFEATISFDDDAIKPEHQQMILDKCGFIGVGAYRQRFGKFWWV